MQIILMEKVVNLGGLGDVVKVKDGYARNFLIPQGKAKRATEANRTVHIGDVLFQPLKPLGCQAFAHPAQRRHSGRRWSHG